MTWPIVMRHDLIYHNAGVAYSRITTFERYLHACASVGNGVGTCVGADVGLGVGSGLGSAVGACEG